jgi:transposase-like protein
MYKCQSCGGVNFVKNGFVREQQRHRCKNCGTNQVSGDKRLKYNNNIRNIAISMYLNSSGIRSIGRVLNVSPQLVSQWIVKAGKITENHMLKEQIEPPNIAILEMDELYTYVQKKSKKYEYGWLLIGTEAKLLHLTSVAERLKMHDNYTGPVRAAEPKSIVTR